MLLNYFFGRQLKIDPSSEDYAQLCFWENGPGASAGIVGLRIVKNNQETYLQFHPKSMVGVADREFTGLMTGAEGSFVSSFRDACLIEGFRRNWNGDRQTLLEMSDDDKLKVATCGDFAEPSLIRLGQPTRQVTLRSLDLDAMIKSIKQIKSEKPLWAPVGGMILHQNNTENCASIVARVLDAGGARDIVPSFNDQVGSMVFLPAVLLGVAAEFETAAQIFVAGRFYGGAYDGYQLGDAIGHLMEKEHKPYATEAGLALKFLGAVVGGIVGTVAYNSSADKLLVLPETLLNFAREIESVERAAMTQPRATRLSM